LGFSKDNPEWYGGKVYFRSKLDCTAGSYKILLERAELGPSYRFARRFGSEFFLRVKIPSKIIKNPRNKLVEYFSRAFVLNGHVFRPFFAKEGTVFMFRTNEAYRGCKIIAGPIESPDLSFLQFLEWHNPLLPNNKQVCVLQQL